MGIFGKKKSRLVCARVTPHHFNGHPDNIISLFKKAKAPFNVCDDVFLSMKGEGRWNESYLLVGPEHLLEKVKKLNNKKKVFRVFEEHGTSTWVDRQFEYLYTLQEIQLRI